MEPENTSKSLVSKVVGVAVALVAVFGVVTYLSQNKKEEAATPTEATETATSQTPPPQTASQMVETTAGAFPTPSSIYKDGTYTAQGTYTSPAGIETVDISLTLASDVVVAATFKGNAENPGSINWQGEFSKGYTQEVVGKKIDELTLTVVNGSSLTPKGFLDAVAKVKTQAKS